MATIAETNELDVISKYRELVQESLGGESVYIRMKETLEDLMNNGSLTEAEKGDLISQTLVSMNNSLVSTSMSIALEWSAKEKDIALKKLELSKQLDILDQEILLKTAQVNGTNADKIRTQAETRRMFGIPTVVDGELTALTDTGKVYADIQLTDQQTANALATNAVIQAQEQENLATAHKIVADTYVNFGRYTYTMDSTGLTSITDNTGAYKTLSYYQGAIAKEQAKGYTYNAWANAASGVSSTVGVALTSGEPIFGTGQIGETLVTNLVTATDNLKNITAPTL